MPWNIHLYLSSDKSLREQRDELEKELEQNKDTRDSEWGISTRRGSIKRELSDISEEIEGRLSND